MKKILLKIYTLTKDDVINIYWNINYSLDPGKIRNFNDSENNNFYKYQHVEEDLNISKCNEIINAEKIKHKIIEKETELQNLIKNIKNRWI